jgi:hypothetical protein
MSGAVPVTIEVEKDDTQLLFKAQDKSKLSPSEFLAAPASCRTLAIAIANSISRAQCVMEKELARCSSLRLCNFGKSTSGMRPVVLNQDPAPSAVPEAPSHSARSRDGSESRLHGLREISFVDISSVSPWRVHHRKGSQGPSNCHKSMLATEKAVVEQLWFCTWYSLQQQTLGLDHFSISTNSNCG